MQHTALDGKNFALVMYVLKTLIVAIVDSPRSSSRLSFSVYNCVCITSLCAECHMLNRT